MPVCFSSSYIAGVDVYYGSKDKPALPPGWELLTTSVGGNGANLNKGGDECYLALKRAPVDILEGSTLTAPAYIVAAPRYTVSG